MIHRPPNDILWSKLYRQLSDNAMKTHQYQNNYLTTVKRYCNDTSLIFQQHLNDSPQFLNDSVPMVI